MTIRTGKLCNSPEMDCNGQVKLTVANDDGGQMKFTRYTATEKLAELAAKYLKKGMPICVWSDLEDRVPVAKRIKFVYPFLDTYYKIK